MITHVPKHLARAITKMHNDHPDEVVSRLNRRYPLYAWRIGTGDGYEQAYTVRQGDEMVEYAYKNNHQTK